MAFAYVQVRRAAVIGEQERLRRVSRQVSDLLHASLATTKGELWRDARRPELGRFLLSPGPGTRIRALAELEIVRGKSPQIVDVALWDGAGAEVLTVGSHGSPVPPIVRQELLAPDTPGDSAMVGSLHVVADAPMLTLAARVVHEGRTIGYLVERARLSASPRAARSFGDLIGNAAGIFLGNARRDIWTDFWVRVEPPPAVPVQRGLVLEYERHGEGGGPKYALERAIAGTPWLLLVEFPRDKPLAPVTAFLRNATLFSLALLVLGAVGVWLVSRNITRPLSELREAALAMTGGDYSRRVSSGRTDELGQLSRAFDDMAGRIAQAQQRLQRRLATVEDQHRVLVDGIEDYAIFMLDRAGVVVSWNRGAERIKGYRSDEIIGHHFSRFYPRQDVAARKPWTELELARREGRAEDEGWRVRKGGSRIWANVVITALHDADGEHVGFAKVTRDISEKRRVLQAEAAHTRALEAAYAEVHRHRQELRVANEELESFTYSVSHDLRAPIRQIEGFSTILEEHLGGDADPQAKQYFRRIRDGSQQMGRLVDDLLHLAQLGRQDAKPRCTPLDAVVQDVLASLRTDVANRDIEWRIGPLPAVVCDPGLMRVVFTNLLSNAVKYTRQRERAVIEVGQRLEDGRTVIYVRDNGVGFDMKYADKLFGVFQRLHRADEYEGTGVGLSIVHRIIRKHNGTISAQAAPGAGATFSFTLGDDTVDQVTDTE